MCTFRPVQEHHEEALAVKGLSARGEGGQPARSGEVPGNRPNHPRAPFATAHLDCPGVACKPRDAV
jgi:hypothetical protein